MAILLDCGHSLQHLKNCQRDANSHSADCPERNYDVGVISLSKLHDASFRLGDECDVFVIHNMSANEMSAEDSGGKVRREKN